MADNSRLFVYDITIKDDDESPESIMNVFEEICKKWTFQLKEGKGKDGKEKYRHYQCRISLKVRVNKKALIVALNALGLKGYHVSPTSAQNMGNDFYVCKTDSRIEGPWRDPESLKAIDMLIPTYLRGTPEWYKWQKTIIELLAMPIDDRIINILLDPVGNQGKTFLASWLSVRGHARMIPPLNCAKDVSAIVLGTPKSRAYFIDLPRAQNKKSLIEFVAALEQIKNGYCYDTRYKYREERFDPPHVWVFSNVALPSKFLSADRWRYWMITPEGELTRVFGCTDKEEKSSFKNFEKKKKKKKEEDKSSSSEEAKEEESSFNENNEDE